jgi:hypothetical protein
MAPIWHLLRTDDISGTAECQVAAAFGTIPAMVYREKSGIPPNWVEGVVPACRSPKRPSELAEKIRRLDSQGVVLKQIAAECKGSDLTVRNALRPSQHVPSAWPSGGSEMGAGPPLIDGASAVPGALTRSDQGAAPPWPSAARHPPPLIPIRKPGQGAESVSGKISITMGTTRSPPLSAYPGNDNLSLRWIKV